MIDEMDLVGRFGEVDPLPSEALERAEAVLRAAMAAAHEPERASAGDRFHQRWLRRRTLTGIVAAAVVAVSACGVLLAARSGTPRAEHVATANRGPRGASRPTTPTTARLVAKVTAALDDVSGDIFSVDTVSQDGITDDNWISPDGNTQRVTTYGPGGVEDYDLTSTVSGNEQSATVVDYPDHAWWDYTEATAPTPNGSNCKLPTCGDVANGGMPPGPDIDGVPGSTAGVKWLISSGDFTVASGTQVVDGVDTYEMTRTLPGGGTRALWINQATDLPVQVQSSGSTLPGNNSMSEVSWLAPTSANLAALQVQIPSGFTHSPSPISPPAPAGGGVG